MQQSLFDMLGSEFDYYKTQDSNNDWFWHLKDYPKTLNPEWYFFKIQDSK